MANEYLERGETKARANSNSSGYYANQYSVDNSERLWTSWLVPSIVVANIAAFVVLMYVNNWPKNNNGLYGDCVAKFLGRLSFQPLKENPLFGPSSSKSCTSIKDGDLSHLYGCMPAAALLTLVFIIILNLAIGILPHVDNFGHIGGLLTGFLLGFIFLLRPQYGWIENQSTKAYPICDVLRFPCITDCRI